MTRLNLLASILVLILLVAIVSARSIGMLHLPPAIASAFTNPDGSLCQMPCLFGLRVKDMPLEDGVALLHKHLLTHDMMKYGSSNDKFVTYANARFYVSFYLSEDRKIVGIQLEPRRYVTDLDYKLLAEEPTFLPRRDITMATAIGWIGSPQYVTLGEHSDDTTTLYYYDGQLKVYLSRSTYCELCTNPNPPVDRFQFNDQFQALIVGKPVPKPAYSHKWFGFTNTKTYWNNVTP